MSHFKVEVPLGEEIVDILVLFLIYHLILACNMIGHVWTVDQDTHNTITCEFYDREAHHQFFFTDPYLYDKACLSTFPD
jgi:Minichromosome loss protein, Mcl1, middle region